jgi:hypothetical protein
MQSVLDSPKIKQIINSTVRDVLLFLKNSLINYYKSVIKMK